MQPGTEQEKKMLIHNSTNNFSTAAGMLSGIAIDALAMYLSNPETGGRHGRG